MPVYTLVYMVTTFFRRAVSTRRAITIAINGERGGLSGLAVRGLNITCSCAKEPVRSLERDGGERDEDACRWLTPLARPSVTINTDVRVFPRTSH